MVLEGKAVNFLGDSITAGARTSGAGFLFTDLLLKNEGLRASRNYGISGTRIARQTARSNPETYDLDFCSRVADMDPDADAVVVFGGTNDWGHGDAPLGVMADRSPYTFYGALHTLYRSLLEKYPEAEIVAVTPLHRLGENDPEEKAASLSIRWNPPLSRYVAAIREVAQYYAVPVLDLYVTSRIQPEIPAVRERFCPDGLHPNDAGHRLIAERMAAFLKSL